MNYATARDWTEGWFRKTGDAIRYEEDAVDHAADIFNAFLASDDVPDDGVGKMILGVVLDLAIGAVPGVFFLSRFWKDRTAGLTDVAREAAQLTIDKGYNLPVEINKKYQEMQTRSDQSGQAWKKKDSFAPPGKNLRPVSFLDLFKNTAKRPLYDARAVMNARWEAARGFITHCEMQKILGQEIDQVVRLMLGEPRQISPDDVIPLQKALTYALFKEYVRRNVVVEVTVRHIVRQGVTTRSTRVLGLTNGKEKDIYSLFGSRQPYTVSTEKLVGALATSALVEGYQHMFNRKDATTASILERWRRSTRGMTLEAVDDPADLVRVFEARQVVRKDRVNPSFDRTF